MTRTPEKLPCATGIIDDSHQNKLIDRPTVESMIVIDHLDT